MMSYINFLQKFDEKLKLYFQDHSDFLCCQKGCSSCCEKGDYPLSEAELKYLMQGFSCLENNIKIQIQKNFKTMQKGGACPFLLDHCCSIYDYRPLVCRVHGLAYLNKNNLAVVPYCVNEGKNYSNVFESSELLVEPIKENLEVLNLAENYSLGEVRSLYDWYFFCS